MLVPLRGNERIMNSDIHGPWVIRSGLDPHIIQGNAWLPAIQGTLDLLLDQPQGTNAVWFKQVAIQPAAKIGSNQALARPGAQNNADRLAPKRVQL